MIHSEDLVESPFTMDPVAATQRGLQAWSRAYTIIMHGLFTAATAEFDLIRSLYGIDLRKASREHPASTHEALRNWFNGAKSKFDHAVNGYRKINDDLGASMLSAVETLIDAWAEDDFDPSIQGQAEQLHPVKTVRLRA